MPVSETTDTFRRPAWKSCVVGDQSARFKNTSSIRATGSILWWWHHWNGTVVCTRCVCVCVFKSESLHHQHSARHFFLLENNRLFASTESWINFLCPQLRAELNLCSTHTHTYIWWITGLGWGSQEALLQGFMGRQRWRICRVRGICSS